MNNKLNTEIAESIREFHFPKYSEIPDIGLFLEQVSKYISGFFEPLGSAAITGSMISNYVKKGLVENPIKKQYYREQIAQLIFIAAAKTVLPLEDIQLLLRIQKEKYDCSIAYEYFRSEFEKLLLYKAGLGEEPEDVESDASDEKIMLRMTILTAVHKIYLDKYFEKMQQSDL